TRQRRLRRSWAHTSALIPAQNAFDPPLFVRRPASRRPPGLAEAGTTNSPRRFTVPRRIQSWRSTLPMNDTNRAKRLGVRLPMHRERFEMGGERKSGAAAHALQDASRSSYPDSFVSRVVVASVPQNCQLVCVIHWRKNWTRIGSTSRAKGLAAPLTRFAHPIHGLTRSRSLSLFFFLVSAAFLPANEPPRRDPVVVDEK